jgi:hypothetical protein
MIFALKFGMMARGFQLRFWRRQANLGIVAAAEQVGIVALVCLLREACLNRLVARYSLAMRLAVVDWLN